VSRVDLEGLCNFRDLGGYATAGGGVVRRGRVYRSDALHRMTAADVDTVRMLGLATVIDLRAPDEVAHVGTGLLDDLGAEYRNLPTRPVVLTAVVDDGPPESAAEHYFGYLAEGRACFGGVVETLAEPRSVPAVFFCNAGKDRTGAVAAMVLGLLGVDDETVAADYARTQEVLAAIGAATSRDYPTDVKAWRNLSPDMRTARAETMLEFLELVRERVGGWSEYVCSLGVDPAAIAAMQTNLVSQDGTNA
jgi:protein-tyrosine phosphatase